MKLLEDRIRTRLDLGGPLTASELADHFGILEPVMRTTLAHMIWPNGKRKPYGDVACNKAGQYFLGDPSPLMDVPE